MPRTARIDMPGLLQHVVARGIERRSIYLDDQDRRSFLQRLARLLKETGTICCGWVLMDNHFHLLLRSGSGGLALFMRRLLTGHAVEFNRRHGRAGHLFQNRYKSIVCDEDTYFLALVRYIHLNPVRAGLLPDLAALETYPWSGHAELTGAAPSTVIAHAEVLRHFSECRQTALAHYRAFLAEGVGVKNPPNLTRGGSQNSRALASLPTADDLFDDRILGGGRFVDELLKVSGPSTLGSRISLEELAARVAACSGIDPGLLGRPDKTRVVANAKAVVSYIATRRLNIPGINVGRSLGLSPSGVTVAAKRGEKILKESPALMESVLGLDAS